MTGDTKKFIHGVIDSICEKQGTRFDQYAKKLTLPEYSRLKSSVVEIVKRVSREGMDKKKLSETVSKLDIQQEIGLVITECIWVRRDEIRGQLVRDASSLSHCNLVDYDWKTKMVLASDKLGSMQEPLLSLDLHLNEAGEKKTENIELSRDELTQLIASLEAANKVVLQLRT